MPKSRLIAACGIIVLAAMSRLIPHPPDFTPIGAMALFGGATLANKRWAFVLPLASLFLSDLVLGFYHVMPFVYGSFALIVVLGLWLKQHRKPGTIVLASVTSSLLFFGVTNFGEWLMSPMYGKTTPELVRCFVAAVPFFRNALVGDLFYAAVLFGGFSLAERWIPALKPEPSRISV